MKIGGARTQDTSASETRDLEARLTERGWTPSATEAIAIRDLAASYLQSDPQRSDRLSEALLRAALGRDAGRAARAVAYRARAEAFVYTGRLKSARDAYESACRLARSARDDGLLAQILVGRVGTLLAMGETKPAERLARRARSLLLQAGDQDYLRRLYVNLGSGHYHRERYAAAHQAFLEAGRLMEAAGQKDQVWAALLLNDAIACTQLSLLDEARQKFDEVKRFAQDHGLEHLVAQADFNLASLEVLRGDYRAALVLLNGVESTFRRIEAGDLLAATFLEQAQIYLDLSMPRDARELARRAGAMFSKEDMRLDAELARLAEARSLLLLERPSEALDLVVRCESFYRNRRIGPHRAVAILEMARGRLAAGEISGARTAVRAALRLLASTPLEFVSSSARCLLAEIELADSRPGPAARALAPIALMLRRLPAVRRMEYWYWLGRAARQLDRRDEALRHLKRSARWLEVHRLLVPGLELRARSFERHVRVYHEQIELLADDPSVTVDRLLEMMERARGRGFRELSVARAATSGEEIRRRRAELASVARRLEITQLRAEPEAASEVQRLRRQALALERGISSRIHATEESGSRPARSQRQVKPTAAAVADVLGPGELFVEYFVAGDRIVACIISAGGREFRTLDATPASVRGALSSLKLQIQVLASSAGEPPNLDFLRRRAESRLREIHDLVLAPVIRTASEARRLLIVAHDFLHEVPFECLHQGGSYVDEAREVVRCPTANFLIARRADAVDAGMRPPRPGLDSPMPGLRVPDSRPCLRTGAPKAAAAVLAGPRPTLPHIESEARLVAARWPAGACRLVLDPDPAAVASVLGNSEIIHIAAHATFRRDNPLFSTLHFGDGVVFLADLLHLRTSARLVVLSACSTAEVYSGPGDALIGVAHAFLACGAQNLVASLWRVHDRATARWMKHFYDSYQAGSTAGAAVRHAARATRQEYPHPFYWGGFCSLGT